MKPKAAVGKIKYVLTREKAPTPEQLIANYMAMIGRKGGQASAGVSTPAKRRAARENGKLGGRPKGSKNRSK